MAARVMNHFRRNLPLLLASGFLLLAAPARAQSASDNATHR